MNLKPFSLGSSTPKKENNPQQNDGIKKYIELNEEDKCISLHIEDPKKSSKIILLFLDNLEIQATKENTETHDKIVGVSVKHFIFNLETIALCRIPTTAEIRDLILLGCIAKALFYAEIPLEAVISDSNILSEFANKALCNCDEFCSNEKVNFSKIMPFIQVQKVYSNIHEEIIWKAILVGKSDENGLLCKGIFGITENYIYIQTSHAKYYEIEIPKFVKSFKDTQHYYELVSQLVWILLTSLHFCGTTAFDLHNSDIKLDLYDSLLEGADFVTPQTLYIELGIHLMPLSNN